MSLVVGLPALRATLAALAEAPRYYAWLHDLLRPFVGQRVLDVGCGLGSLVPLYADADLAVAMDVDAFLVREARARWGHLSHVSFLQGDICDARTVDRLRSVVDAFDTVLMVNVLEHLIDDRQGLRHAVAALADNGFALIYAPAHPWLLGRLDQGLGHRRRYTRRRLEGLAAACGLRVVMCRPVNTLGLFGWAVDNYLARYAVIPLWQVKLFDLAVPTWRRVEDLLRRVWPSLPGLSWLCVAQKVQGDDGVEQ